MRLIEFAALVPELSERGERLAVLGELPDHLGTTDVVMSLRHVDAAVGPDDDVVRLEAAFGQRSARLPERHQHLASGAELEDLVALGRTLAWRRGGRGTASSGRRCASWRCASWRRAGGRGAPCGTRSVVGVVGDPHV